MDKRLRARLSRGLTLLAALGALAACGPRSKIGYPSFGDPTRYRRVGVLPFSGPGAERVADLVSAGLSRAGIVSPAPAELASLFDRLKLKRSSELSISQLVEVHRETGVEALVFGHVSGDSRAVSLLMIDTDMGDVAMEARLYPTKGRRFGGPEDMAAVSLAAILRPPKTVDGVALPKD